MSKPGFFITLEGVEGVGKSTQIARLAEYLASARRRKTVVTREPGGTPLAEKLRELVKYFHGAETVTETTELLLMEAARSQHVANVIRPALEAGSVVLCDRFCDSTTAYQGYGRGMNLEQVARCNALAVADCVPDLTLVLELSPEKGMARAALRAGNAPDFDRFESQKKEFFERVAAGFRHIAAAEPERVKLIDADAAVETVFARIREAVDAAL